MCILCWLRHGHSNGEHELELYKRLIIRFLYLPFATVNILNNNHQAAVRAAAEVERNGTYHLEEERGMPRD